MRPRLFWRSVLWVVLCCGAALMILVSRPAAAAGVTVDVTPSTLQLAPGERATVVLTVRNETGSSLLAVTLWWPAEPGLTLLASTTVVDRIAAGTAATWNVDVARSADAGAGAASSQPLGVRYTTTGADGAPVTDAGTTVLTVQSPPVRQIADLVDLHVSSGDAQLMGGRDAQVVVQVGSRADLAVTLSSLRITAPAFLTVCRVDASCPASSTGSGDRVTTYAIGEVIGPLGSDVQRLTLRAGDAVEPGQHPVVVEAALTWTEAGRVRTGTAVATTQVGTAVYGESAILTLLQVPSLFVLPGLLVVVTFRLLWRYLRPGVDLPLLQLGAVEFWMSAISVSLLAFLVVYPGVLVGANLRSGTYSLQDIAVVWAYAIVAGAALYLAAVSTRAAFLAWLVPTSRDSPARVLLKLARRRISWSRPRAGIPIDGHVEHAYVVFRAPWHPEAWVSPGITIAERAPLPADFAARLDRALHGSGSRGLARVLREGARKGHLKVSWEVRPDLSGPRPVDPRTLKEGRSQWIVHRAGDGGELP